jgi:hypothetical protein
MCRGAGSWGAQKGCKCERRAHRHHRKVMAAPVIGPGTYEFGGTSSNLVSKKLGRIFGAVHFFSLVTPIPILFGRVGLNVDPGRCRGRSRGQLRERRSS